MTTTVSFIFKTFNGKRQNGGGNQLKKLRGTKGDFSI